MFIVKFEPWFLFNSCKKNHKKKKKQIKNKLSLKLTIITVHSVHPSCVNLAKTQKAGYIWPTTQITLDAL